MIPLFSKHNQVYPLPYQGYAAVEKHFTSLSDLQKEKALYRALRGKLALPEIRKELPDGFIMDYCPCPTLLEVLQQQEQTGFSPLPWQVLSQWLRQCHAVSGRLPDDGNLRNFLWDPARQRIIGVDFEGYCHRNLAECGADLAASVLSYTPENTGLKQQVARLLLSELNSSDEQLRLSSQALSAARKLRRPFPRMSGIILAGGRSCRMGRDKSTLPLLDRSFLRWQVDKMRALGIDDIILSGEGCPSIPGTRVVADRIPERGPLGGIYSCLCEAQHERCLTLSVDVPFLPAAALYHLCRTSADEPVTMLSHAGRGEPLIAVYDRSVGADLSRLLRERSISMHSFTAHFPVRFFPHLGSAERLCNCNTPQDYTFLCALAGQYSALRLPLL